MVPERNNNYTFIIEVDCDEGEENISITEISLDELNQVNPLLLDIRENQGYYPTGDFLVYPDPSPEEFYGTRFRESFDILESRLPCPKSGFKRILEIKVFSVFHFCLILFYKNEKLKRHGKE